MHSLEVPMTIRVRETEIATPDRQRLFVRCYEPPRPSGRTLLISHGASEHGERYRHVAEFFADKTWTVIVGDHRGHGRSTGVRTHIKRFRQYAHDLELIRNHFDLASESTAVLGHSMGGLVAIRHAQLYPGHAAALVLTSPLLRVKVPIPRRTIALGRVLSVLAPRTRFRSTVDPKTTTRCPMALERRLNDALMHRSVTAKWFFAMRAGLKSAWTAAGQITNPVLVLQAGADEIVDPKAPESWLHQVASQDKAFLNFPEHLHELLNEPDWPDTASLIANWLTPRTALGPHHPLMEPAPMLRA
jgi:lysophospholipase